MYKLCDTHKRLETDNAREHPNSTYEITFDDWCLASENNIAWRDICHSVTIDGMVYFCAPDVKAIQVTLNGKTIEVEKRERTDQVFFANTVSQTLQGHGGVFGRKIGIIREGRVVEEKTIFESS